MQRGWVRTWEGEHELLTNKAMDQRGVGKGWGCMMKGRGDKTEGLGLHKIE